MMVLRLKGNTKILPNRGARVMYSVPYALIYL